MPPARFVCSGLTRHPQFAHQQDIKGSLQRPGNFTRHEDATAWQAKHDSIWAIGVVP
jgi:hypothetical protein